MAHRFMGNAAYLAPQEVAMQAGELDQVLKDAVDPIDILRKLQEALEIAFASIEINAT